MYVYIHKCIYINVYTYMYIYNMYVYTYVYTYVNTYVYNQINMILGVSEKRVIAPPTWPLYKWTMGKMPTQGNGRYPIFRRKQGTMNKHP